MKHRGASTSFGEFWSIQLEEARGDDKCPERHCRHLLLHQAELTITRRNFCWLPCVFDAPQPRIRESANSGFAFNPVNSDIHGTSKEEEANTTSACLDAKTAAFVLLQHKALDYFDHSCVVPCGRTLMPPVPARRPRKGPKTSPGWGGSRARSSP